MSGRRSVHGLLAVIVLSQVLVLQALLLSWSGALAFAGQLAGDIGSNCTRNSEGRGSGDTEFPGGPEQHLNCLDACLAGQVMAELPDTTGFMARSVIYVGVSFPATEPLSEIVGLLAFSARAPPTLV